MQIDSSNSRRAQPEGADSAYRVPVGAILLVMTIAGILSQLSVGLVDAWLMSAAAVALGAAAVLLRLPRSSASAGTLAAPALPTTPLRPAAAVTGMLFSLHRRRMAATCSVVVGETTADAIWPI